MPQRSFLLTEVPAALLGADIDDQSPRWLDLATSISVSRSRIISRSDSGFADYFTVSIFLNVLVDAELPGV